MDLEKKKIIEQFIDSCQKLGLPVEECVDLAARNLVGVVSASGKSYAKIEIDGSGTVEVEC